MDLVLDNSDDGKQPKVGVGAMIFKEGRILLGKRKSAHGKNCYAFPSGKLEFKESLIDCAKRETKEETDITIEMYNFFCIVNFSIGEEHYADFIYTTNVPFTTIAKIKEKEKVVSWDWYNLNELPQPLFPPAEQAINNYISTSRTLVIDLCETNK